MPHRRTPSAESLATRAQALETEHARLEAKLSEEMRRPLPDLGRVQELKRLKLKAKDELAALEGVLRVVGARALTAR